MHVIFFSCKVCPVSLVKPFFLFCSYQRTSEEEEERFITFIDIFFRNFFFGLFPSLPTFFLGNRKKLLSTFLFFCSFPLRITALKKGGKWRKWLFVQSRRGFCLRRRRRRRRKEEEETSDHISGNAQKKIERKGTFLRTARCFSVNTFGTTDNLPNKCNFGLSTVYVHLHVVMYSLS